jgi:uncharacterized protein YkwD
MQQAVDRRRFARCVLIAGLVIGLVSFLPTKADAATSSAEKQMASLINKSRANAGRAPLVLSGTLSTYARKHSAKMMAKNTIFHNSSLAKTLSGISWKILGENVGMGGSITSLHNAFMDSPGHRANNLDKRFKKVGVGVTSKNGRLWVTVIFQG